MLFNKYYIKKLDLIQNNLIELDKRLTKIEKSCGHMDSHINFIDSVYSHYQDNYAYASIPKQLDSS